MAKITPANYQHWIKADLWTIERGILLLINAETLPGNNYYSTGKCDTAQEQAVYDKFMEIWGIVDGSLIAGTLKRFSKGLPGVSTLVKPVDFIDWAHSKGYEIPAELNYLTKSIKLEPQAEAVGNDTYNQRRNSFESWRVSTGIDIQAPTLNNIFQQVKLTNKSLWQIDFASFKRDFWQMYCRETGIKKKPGRPPKK